MIRKLDREPNVRESWFHLTQPPLLLRENFKCIFPVLSVYPKNCKFVYNNRCTLIMITFDLLLKRIRIQWPPQKVKLICPSYIIASTYSYAESINNL